MITYKPGDLFTDINPNDVVLHNINCFCTWGAGFAKSAKEHMPNLYAVDLDSTKGNFLKLGTHISATEEIGDHQFTSVAVYGQYNYSRTRKVLIYERISDALIQVNNEILKGMTDPIVKMPKIGSDLAGGDWDKIANIIQCALTHAKEVIVYDLRKL